MDIKATLLTRLCIHKDVPHIMGGEKNYIIYFFTILLDANSMLYKQEQCSRCSNKEQFPLFYFQ